MLFKIQKKKIEWKFEFRDLNFLFLQFKCVSVIFIPCKFVIDWGTKSTCRNDHKRISIGTVGDFLTTGIYLNNHTFDWFYKFNTQKPITFNRDTISSEIHGYARGTAKSLCFQLLLNIFNIPSHEFSFTFIFDKWLR